MNDKILIPGLAVASLVVAVLAAPVLATAVGDFLTIRRAEVEYDDEELEALIRTEARIILQGAYGYGVLTDSGDIIVTTTHGVGVRDSELQSDGFDPVMHNHYVTLATGEEDCKDPERNPAGLQVVNLTFKSPGEVDVEGRTAELDDVPTEFKSRDARTNANLEINAGTPTNVVSFTLSVPHFPDVDVVCVNDVKPANKVVIEQDD